MTHVAGHEMSWRSKPLVGVENFLVLQFRKLLSDPVLRARVLAAIRHGTSMLSGALIAWLNRKGFSVTDSATIAGDIIGIAGIVGAQLFAAIDVKVVDNKINAIAALAQPGSSLKIAQLKG